MLVNCPATEAWRKHIFIRFMEAIDCGLFSHNSTFRGAAKVFIPEDFNKNLFMISDPYGVFIRDLYYKYSNVDFNKWVLRPDLFEETSLWLYKEAIRKNYNWIFCQAGYLEMGDRVLETRQHIILSGRPFYSMQTSKASVSSLTTMLRRGRSWQLFGGMMRWNDTEPFRSSEGGLFFCDAFDGDSMLVVNIGIAPKPRNL